MKTIPNEEKKDDGFLTEINNWLTYAETEQKRLGKMRDEGEDAEPNWSLNGRSIAQLNGVVKLYKKYRLSQPPLQDAKDKEIIELNHAIVIKVEQLATKEKEVERLKGLIEDLVDKFIPYETNHQRKVNWEQFKMENNIF